MKRLIKFRAWDKLAKEMIPVERDWEIFSISEPSEVFEIMQFTGLKDKSGKEIYEGDIVKDIMNVISEIVFIDEMFCGRCQNGMKAYKWRECKIIGNIHENPNLLTNNL